MTAFSAASKGTFDATLTPLLSVLSLLLMVLIAGCQVGGSKSFVQGTTPAENNATYGGEPVTGDWVITNLLDEPESLNPFTSTSASATNINNYIYESFLRTERQPSWDNEPWLVEEMPQISEDHLRYTWKLREDVRWQDGTPLTMRDAEFSLKTIMNPYVDDLPSKPYYAELDSVWRPDDYNLTMFCSQPYFMHLDFLGGFVIIPRHVFDPEGLLDSLSYYQVKNGSAFGRLAELLESSQELNWTELPEAAALTALEKSLAGANGGKIEWKDIVKSLDGFSTQPVSIQLARVLEFLKDKPETESSQRIAEEVQQSASDVLSTLPLAGEINRLATSDGLPLRAELAALCRDYHTRIQTFGEKFNSHPQGRAPTVGSGPYKFEKWTTGQELVLARNENYWRGPGHAWLDKLVFRVLTDYTASLVALKNGEIDFMENLQTIQYLTMTNRRGFLDKFIKSTFIIPSYGYIGWNNRNPIFKDKLVRRAMTHMVRRKDARDKLLFGFAEMVTSSFYRYGPDYDSTLVPLEYDPEEAQRLLAQQGWKDVDNDGILEKDSLKFRFEILIPSVSPFAEQLVSIMREDLYMIGVEMSIRRLEWSVFINNYIRNHNFDACMLGWVFGMRNDPKQVWHSQFASGRGSNHIEFRNARVDSIIDAARVEFDVAKRTAMYHEFQQIIHDEQPYTFLFSSMVKPAYARRFKGVKWYPFRPGYQLDEWFVPKEEQKYQ
ncbi:MAG: ABC transporter substrate-binding protein [Calditrichota bacterium]